MESDGNSHAEDKDNMVDKMESSGNARSLSLSSSINEFAQMFYVKYKESKSKESNLVFSPLSIHVALAMLASGATEGSSTQKELLKVLGNPKSIRDLEEEYVKLINAYNKDKGGHYGKISNALELANRVWMTRAEKTNVKQSYKDLMRDSYSIDLAELPENDPANAVNDWVKEKTKGKIEKLFEDLSRDTKFLLTNVIYFHDAWTTEFNPIPEPHATHLNLNFTLHDGAVKSNEDVKWMTRSSSHFNLREDVVFGAIKTKVISLPTEHDYDYGRRNKNRFDVVLVVPDYPDKPEKIHDLETYMKGNMRFMDVINKEMAMERPYDNDVNVYMPMFSLKGSADVAKILKDMDVKGIFQKGEFSKIYDGETLKVGNILHKATVDVDDQGVVAAAATGVELVPLSSPIITGTLKVDRPFMFVIRDAVNGFPIFMGKVMDPTRPE